MSQPSPTYGTVPEVAVLLGRELSPAEQAQAQKLLSRAEVMITRALGPLDVAISDGDVTGEQISMVEESATARVLRNPMGVKSETVGPFQLSLDASGSTLTITDDDWALLGISTKVGAYSAAPLYAANDANTPWAGWYAGTEPDPELDWT